VFRVEGIVYIRMKKKLKLNTMQDLELKDIAHIVTSHKDKRKLEMLPIYKITKKDKNIVVIDSFIIIQYINVAFPNLDIQLIGPSHSIIYIESRKKFTPTIMITLVWLVLFVGSAMTIINFHYDVSMQEVQQKLHYLITGRHNDSPLWIQIPYSLGLGAGMLLFFNHWFNKRINEEPSPLEIEIYNYQQNLDHYLAYYENDINDTKPPS